MLFQLFTHEQRRLLVEKANAPGRRLFEDVTSFREKSVVTFH